MEHWNKKGRSEIACGLTVPLPCCRDNAHSLLFSSSESEILSMRIFFSAKNNRPEQLTFQPPLDKLILTLIFFFVLIIYDDFDFVNSTKIFF
ncbi:MAG: hypothetical protein ACI4UV_15450 [Victivallales bacterium]